MNILDKAAKNKMSKKKQKRPNKSRRKGRVRKGQKSSTPGKVIELKNVRISGFALDNVSSGETARVLYRASLTSDQREFHVYMDGITNLITQCAHEAGVIFSPDHLSGFVLVINQNDAASLFLDSSGISLEVMAKRPVKAGEAVFRNDIGDIRRASVVNVDVQPQSKIVVCFKVGWKFGLFLILVIIESLKPVEWSVILGRCIVDFYFNHCTNHLLMRLLLTE